MISGSVVLQSSTTKSEIMYGIMFDIADVTGYSALEHIFNSPFVASLHWQLLFKRYINNCKNAAMCSHNLLVAIATSRQKGLF